MNLQELKQQRQELEKLQAVLASKVQDLNAKRTNLEKQILDKGFKTVDEAREFVSSGREKIEGTMQELLPEVETILADARNLVQ